MKQDHKLMLSVYKQSFLITFLLLSFSFSLSAQSNRERPTAEKENELIFANIEGLSDKQKEKITKINEDFFAKSQVLFKNSNGDRQAMQEKRKALRDEKHKALQDVFTEGQFKKYQLLLKKQRAERGKRRRERPKDGGS